MTTATDHPGEFMIPLKAVAAVRNDFHRRGQQSTEAAAAVWEYAADRLQGLCNDARAAGKGAPRWDDPTVEEVAVARDLQVTAAATDRFHERITRALNNGVDGHQRMVLTAERDDNLRHAQRLWHALLIVMEHTGIGPEQLLTEDAVNKVLDHHPPNLGK